MIVALFTRICKMSYTGLKQIRKSYLQEARRVNIITKVKDKANDIVEKRRQHQLEKRQREQEYALRKAQEEQERLKEEEARIAAERERLINLDNKEILAEAILAIRGFYQEHIEIKSRLEEAESDISELESDLSSIRSELAELRAIQAAKSITENTDYGDND